MTTTTATAPTTFVFPDPTKPLDIPCHFYNLDKALHAGGDAAVEIYETQTLLTDYPNGAAVRVFDGLDYVTDDEPTWDDVKKAAEWFKVEHTPQLVADIRALCEDTITYDASLFTPGPEEQHAERWIMQAEALLAN